MYQFNFYFKKLAEVSYAEAVKFGVNQRNRLVNHPHAQKMKKQFMKYGKFIQPVVVNNVTNHIIDGQHRLYAYLGLIENGDIPKDTKINVEYISASVDVEMELIIDANTNTKGWSLDNYIASYVKAGIPSYVRLEEWCKAHSLCFDGNPKYRYGAAMLTGKRCQQSLRNQTFEFDDSNVKLAEEVHTEVLEIMEMLGLKDKGAWIEALTVTWYQYRSMHPFRVWLGEIKNKKRSLDKMPKDNSKEWEAIFNTVHGAIDKKSSQQ